MGAIVDAVAACFVFEAARVVTIGSDADAHLGDLAVDVLTAAPPLLRGKKKPFRVIGG